MSFAERSFLRALQQTTKRYAVVHADDERSGNDEPGWDLGTDEHGFYTATPRELGKLWGLLFDQAQGDGASSIKLYYGVARMVYTLDGTDFDMVPPPAPLNADMCRLLAKSTKTRWDTPGTLTIDFADLSIELQVFHRTSDGGQSYLEITGLTGKRRERGEHQRFALQD